MPAKKDYTLLAAIIGAIATISASFITWYFSKCDDKQTVVVSSPNVNIKTDSTSNSNIAPVIQQNEKGKNEVNQDFSRQKKEIHGDYVHGDKVVGDKNITDNRTTGPVIRGGDSTIIYNNQNLPRKLTLKDKNRVDAQIPEGSTVIIA